MALNLTKQDYDSASLTSNQIRTFRKKILSFYALHGRKLPWRKTTDPYRIAIAEIMLQQTQVERVIPKYQAWISRWPNWKSLARANTRELLHEWSGLGYNRRALYLGRMARYIVDMCDGVLPSSPVELQALPGIGLYTSRAILIFAFNKPIATIDTNIRRVLIHELKLPPAISAKELEEIALTVLPKKRSRDWHNALMDYSRLVLPRRIANIPPRSVQSKFHGSLRQIRGEIIRQLTRKKSVRVKTISEVLSRDEVEVLKAAGALQAEGTVVLRGKRIVLVLVLV
ncbi:MAG: Fe-S cluster assembly protein HesB [candidate division Zixibacteria bacterium]|nr:Fe-S cluster assembly protein HesB [candidate division Zixibacteria bacterium]